MKDAPNKVVLVTAQKHSQDIPEESPRVRKERLAERRARKVLLGERKETRSSAPSPKTRAKIVFDLLVTDKGNGNGRANSS